MVRLQDPLFPVLRPFFSHCHVMVFRLYVVNGVCLGLRRARLEKFSFCFGDIWKREDEGGNGNECYFRPFCQDYGPSAIAHLVKLRRVVAFNKGSQR